MGRTVRRSVAVHNPETGESHWFHDGDQLPTWADKLVTNPKVFEPLEGSEDELNSRVSKMALAPDSDPDNQPVEYEDMNKSQLEELLEERGLAKSGNKDELIERLRAHDESNG